MRGAGVPDRSKMCLCDSRDTRSADTMVPLSFQPFLIPHSGTCCSPLIKHLRVDDAGCLLPFRLLKNEILDGTVA